MKPIELSAIDATRLRLAGQRLDRPAKAAALIETAGEVGGIQAQVASAGRLSLAVRVEGATDRAIGRALSDAKTLSKIWTMRGTLHFVPSDEVALHVAGFGAVRTKWLDSHLHRSGLAHETVIAACDDVVEALEDGALTRREIAEKVGDRHGLEMKRWIVHSWGGILRRVVYDGRVMFGPARGTEVTFIRSEQWLPAAARKRRWSNDDAEAELARRFLRAYGPATLRDFAYWAGMYKPESVRMWERIAKERVEVRIEGVKSPMYVHRDVLRRAKDSASADSPHVLLLPHFDTYLLGHRDKAAYLDSKHYKRVFRTAGWISPVVLVDGRVLGVWSGERRGDRYEVRVTPFGRWPRGLRPLVAERAKEMGERLGLKARLSASR